MHRIIECVCAHTCRHLNELAQVPVGAGKSEICGAASLLETQAGVDVADLRQNFLSVKSQFLLLKTSVNWVGSIMLLRVIFFS